MRAARGSLVLHVPYVTESGLKRLMPYIAAAVKRGLTVTVILQQPRQWENRGTANMDAGIATSMNLLELLMQWLSNNGAHVILRKRIHAKLILIDDAILWEGSLNFLSHFDTSEHVRRSSNWREVLEVKERHKLKEIPSYVQGTVKHDQIHRMLAQRREGAGLSQADIAQELDMDKSEISRMERGRRRLLNTCLTKVLDALDLRLILVPAYLSGPVDEFVQNLLRPREK
jgi:DNA-binding XRE family transcriptional regulator